MQGRTSVSDKQRTDVAKTILIKTIICDPKIQARAGICKSTAIEYSVDLDQGAKFPPVVVFTDGKNRWLADGFHRIEAAGFAGKKKVAAVIKRGTRRDAILYSVGCNNQHGLRRSNVDKRTAVNMLLYDREWKKWSHREIARRCGVSNRFVTNLYNEHLQKDLATVNGSQLAPSSPTRIGKDGKTRKVPSRRKRAVPQRVPPIDEPATKKPVEEKPAERSGGVELEQLQDAFETYVSPQLEVASRAIQGKYAKWVAERCAGMLETDR